MIRSPPPPREHSLLTAGWWDCFMNDSQANRKLLSLAEMSVHQTQRVKSRLMRLHLFWQETNTNTRSIQNRSCTQFKRVHIVLDWFWYVLLHFSLNPLEVCLCLSFLWGTEPCLPLFYRHHPTLQSWQRDVCVCCGVVRPSVWGYSPWRLQIPQDLKQMCIFLLSEYTE